MYVGGDLFVKDDVVYDEVTGRNLNITGVGTIAVIHGDGSNITGLLLDLMLPLEFPLVHLS